MSARLLAELARARPDPDRVAALAAGVDTVALRGELERRRLLPLLGGRLCALAPMPAEFCSAVESARTLARAVGLARQMETEWVLETVGVPALPLKGTTLAQDAHGDLGLRSSSDIDVLVAREDLPAAVERLRSHGYLTQDEDLPALHVLMYRPGRVHVELHWRVHWYETEFARELLANPDVAHTGASLLLFYARDGFHGLRLAADVAAWHDRHEADGLLDELALRHPGLARTWSAAALAAERIVGVPATSWLSSDAGLDRRARLAVRLANPAEIGVAAQRAADILLVDLLLSPVVALPTVIRREAGTAPDGRRGAHLLKKAARCARSLISAMTGPKPSSSV